MVFEGDQLILLLQKCIILLFEIEIIQISKSLHQGIFPSHLTFFFKIHYDTTSVKNATLRNVPHF